MSFCDDFIEKMPNGYDTIIGENGVRISGGEKQRLSIARAMLKESKIILLDEATSSLDTETEEKIQNAINHLTKGKTTLVIAHRLSTVINSNKIYVIEKGEVIGEGSHNDLIKSSGFRIGPTEIEDSLLSHYAVAEAAVIGKPDPDRGSIVKAFIKLRKNYKANNVISKKITAFVKENLAAYKAPREIEFVENFRMTSSGKINRRVLREREERKAKS